MTSSYTLAKIFAKLYGGPEPSLEECDARDREMYEEIRKCDEARRAKLMEHRRTCTECTGAKRDEMCAAAIEIAWEGLSPGWRMPSPFKRRGE